MVGTKETFVFGGIVGAATSFALYWLLRAGIPTFEATPLTSFLSGSELFPVEPMIATFTITGAILGAIISVILINLIKIIK